MKTSNIIISIFTMIHSHAATVTQVDPAAGGIGYAWSVTLSGDDFGITTNVGASNVGAWSWEDQGLFAPGDPTRGWTHTSSWAAIELTSAAYFTLTLSGNSNIPNGAGFRPTDNFFPSFSLFSGWDNDAMPDAVAISLGATVGSNDFHTYNNRGNIEWAEDLSFVGMLENSTESSAQRTWLLPAGQYSIALGSNAPSSTSPPRQGYLATFTTSQIPEPSSSSLIGLTFCGLVLRRRR